MSELLRRDLAAEIHVRSEGDGRTLDLRLLPWDQVTETADGREMFRRGAFAGTDPAGIVIEAMRHDGELVGRGLELEERDDAAYLTARISETRAGDDLLTLVRDGVLRRVSVAFEQPRGGASRRGDGVTERRRVELRRVAVLERGAYPTAGVLAIREESKVTDAIEPVAEAPAPPDLSPILDRLGELDARIGALSTIPTIAPLQYRARTLGELLTTAYDDRAEGKGLLKRVLSDQLTGDNPGLVPPGVSRQAALIVSAGRPAIDAVGTDPLPSSGMTTQWPILTTPLTGLIAIQAAEKTAVISAKVSFDAGTAPIRTFAGGSDISYQLIRRSDPPYLEQYARVMLAAYAMTTDKQFTLDMLSLAAGSVVLTPAMDAAAIVAALVQASIDVQTATGSPASAVVVAADLFAAIAKAYAPTSVNPMATGGTALASTLEVSVSGLRITYDPNLAAGTGFVTNGVAAAWQEDGPFQITVDDAEKLGQNTAYWGLGATAVYAPAGVIEVVPVVGATATTRTREAK